MLKRLRNKKGEIFTVSIYAFALITFYGAYKTHIGDWGKNGAEAVERTAQWYEKDSLRP